MDQDFQEKYNAYKLTVKQWETEFKQLNKRIPSKVNILKQNYQIIKNSSQSFNSF